MISTETPLHFHEPNIAQKIAEKLGFRQITPADIVPPDELESLYSTYPDLAGDKDLGEGNEGDCQSYKGNKYWWKDFVKK